MDALTVLFFEDAVGDGIQVADQANEFEGAGPERSCGNSNAIDGGNEDEIDGSTMVSLHNFIQRKQLLPSDLKKGLKNNWKIWKEQINQVDENTQLAPIHQIATNVHSYTTLLLLNLITYGNADIDARTADGKTALMLAVEANNIELVKTLIAIGANVNLRAGEITALKLAIDISGAHELVKSTDSCNSVDLRGFEKPYSAEEWDIVDTPKPQSMMVDTLKSVGATHNSQEPPRNQQELPITVDHNAVAKIYHDLTTKVQSRRSENSITMPNSTLATEFLEAFERAEAFRKVNGSRILCLDGGGVRGLVQIEILRQIEQKTGRKIVNLFDWIVGTSSGGIIALALVYGKLKVTDLQRFYLRLKRNVFSRSGVLEKGNSKQLEWYLKETLKGTMDKVTHPKVLVSAVKQEQSALKLTFFNNCFEDDFSKEEVWKVARYTSAAPLYFTVKDGYLDGGLLSDNPTEDALTVIQQFYRKRQLKLPISLVVSLGSGVNPIESRKLVDITTDLWRLPSQILPFMKMLGEAVMNQQADENCSSRCTEQNITYICLSPKLNKEVDSGETDNNKLIEMLWLTRQYIHKAKDENNRYKMDVLEKAFLVPHNVKVM